MDDQREDPDRESDGSVDDMLRHLDEAKGLEDAGEARRSRTGSGLRDKIRRRTDVAILASNHEARLKETVTSDAVTHRSGKRWSSAKAGVEAHGRLPIYYRLDGEVTHKAYITRLELDPDEDTPGVEEFVRNIPEADTYSDYNERLDTTTFLVRDGERLDEPFSQSELRKLDGGEPIDEDYSYQPAYVRQRPGDFPDFP